ncbi:MAG: T9SS type A sorting domain-containing protein [Candidatus Eisenbacteria bacterium]|nr:T9SS type A sorting domain-containing protein [Candidatus Eisenbacteria bacterium]
MVPSSRLSDGVNPRWRGMAMRRTLFCFAILAAFAAGAPAQLSGPLSGTLPADTYSVVGPISVDDGDTLLIEAGAELRFEGAYGFTILGRLRALGAEGDSIRFVNAPGHSWWGTHFVGLPLANESRMQYCVVEGSSRGGIFAQNCEVVIAHSSIRGNTTDQDYGAGIYCNSLPSPTISHCIIEDNIAPHYGGGIGIYYSAPNIDHCLIRNNHSVYGGGGIYADQGFSATAAVIEDCTIAGNSCDRSGGGIRCYRGGIAIRRCHIAENISTGYFGGAIYSDCVEDGSPSMLTTVEHSVIAGNAGLGAVWMDFASASIAYCTLSGNAAGGWGAFTSYHGDSSSVVGVIIEGTGGYGIYPVASPGIVKYCDFHGNSLGDLHGPSLPGFGELVGTNANGDSCDVYMNIFEPPLFVDPMGGDYHLQAGSACIDAGDPGGPLDPDGTTADMGALYYDQSSSRLEQATSLLTPVVAAYPNPFARQTTIAFILTRAQWVAIEVFNLSGAKVRTFTRGVCGAGRHQVVWDGRDSRSRRLAAGVYFVRLDGGAGEATRRVTLLR